MTAFLYVHEIKIRKELIHPWTCGKDPERCFWQLEIDTASAKILIIEREISRHEQVWTLNIIFPRYGSGKSNHVSKILQVRSLPRHFNFVWTLVRPVVTFVVAIGWIRVFESVGLIHSLHFLWIEIQNAQEIKRTLLIWQSTLFQIFPLNSDILMT